MSAAQWQKTLEKADEYAEYLLKLAKYQPAKLIEPGTIVTKGKSITSKLLQIYLEESAKVSEPTKRLNRATHLLDKLVRKEKLNTLVVNLYPGNDGYSLMLRGRGGTDTETMRLPYEETELLDYIDNEELPPVLLDLMEKVPCNLFYNGCVIVELRDYRRALDGRFESRHILLRPGAQSMWSDIKAITNDGRRWTQDDIFTLESQLIMATQEPLCLDPSPAVFLIENKAQHERRKYSIRPLKKAMARCSQMALNRRNKMRECRAPDHLRLHDFIKFRKPKLTTQVTPNLRIGEACVDMWRRRETELLPLKEPVDVEKYATVYEKPKFTSDTSPVTVEEYILEAEREQDKICYTRLKIQQRLSDDSYVGELYVDRDHKEGKFNGSSCKFTLGSKFHSKKYIEQFTEIFTEEGRRAVKITHLVPDHPPQISFTHGASAQQAAHLEQASSSQAKVQSRKPIELPSAIGSPPGQSTLPVVTPAGPLLQNTAPVFPNLNVQLAKSRSLPGLQKLTPSPQTQTVPSFAGPSLVPKPTTPQDAQPRPARRLSEQSVQPGQGQFVQSLPAGINLHNLANLQSMGLVQSLQVSVTGVSGGQIAVPLSMINTTQSSLLQQSNANLLTTPTGIIINSVPSASTSTQQSHQQHQQGQQPQQQHQQQQNQQQILLNANLQKNLVPVSVGAQGLQKASLVPVSLAASVQSLQKASLVPVPVQQGQGAIQGISTHQMMQLTPQQQEERQRQFLALRQQQQQRQILARGLSKIKRKKST